jgi:AAA+ superfamily predicted ATPase
MPHWFDSHRKEDERKPDNEPDTTPTPQAPHASQASQASPYGLSPDVGTPATSYTDVPPEPKSAGPTDTTDTEAMRTGPTNYTRATSATDLYEGSDDRLMHELSRIDQLVRAQTTRWQYYIGDNKPPHLWGMLQVSDAEIKSYLDSPSLLPEELPKDLVAAITPYREEAQSIANAIQARLKETPPDRLEHLKHIFGLNNTEVDVLLICLLSEIDARYRRLFAYLLDDASRTQPTVELVLQILQVASSQEQLPFSSDSPLESIGKATHPIFSEDRLSFSDNARLIAHSLVVLGGDERGSDTLPLSARSLRLDDRISAYLLGGDGLDIRLAGVASIAPAWSPNEKLILYEEHQKTLDSIIKWCQEPLSEGAQSVLLLHGLEGSGQLKAARYFCHKLEKPLLLVDVDSALRAEVGWDKVVQLAYREALLMKGCIYWQGCEVLHALDHPAHHWAHLVETAEKESVLTFFEGQTVWYPAGRFHSKPFIHLEFPAPGIELRTKIWHAYLLKTPHLDKDQPWGKVVGTLANSFQLNEGRIADALATARAEAIKRDPVRPLIVPQDLYEACRKQSGRRLLTFASRIEPHAGLTFKDLILPPQNCLQINDLRRRTKYLNYVQTGLGFERRLTLGKGLIALFTGSSGTGKTMTAQLLAGENHRELYKVDLSAIVSKWVGETEKNLSRVFSEAADANAILFFDEADALFGKRGEVKEAQDRWANNEINYLLQQVEEYRGVVILASNMRQNIDEAFMRRISLVVEFPRPNAQARFKILRGMFPSGIQRPPDVELCALANRFKLTGGNLKNVVLDATYQAVAVKPSAPLVTTSYLVLAIGREYLKLGKPITLTEFGQEYYPAVSKKLLGPEEDPGDRLDCSVVGKELRDSTVE